MSARTSTSHVDLRRITQLVYSGSAFPATLAFQMRELERKTNRALVLDAIIIVIDAGNLAAGYEKTSVTARMQAQCTDLLAVVCSCPHPLAFVQY